MIKFLIKIVFLFPLAIGVAAINYYEDPNHLFDSKYIQGIAETLTRLGRIEISGEFDYRLLQKAIIETRDRASDVLIMGTSRGMEIASDHLEEKFAFNSSLPAGTLKDMIAILYLYENKDIVPKSIILEVSPWIFKVTGRDDGWISLYDEYFEGLKAIHKAKGKDVFRISFLHKVKFLYKVEKWLALFSPTYLKLSVRSIFSNHLRPTQNASVEKQSFIAWDGSLHRSQDEEGVAIEEINRRAHVVSGYSKMDLCSPELAEMKEDFDDLLFYLHQKEVAVKILLVPVHPFVYQYVHQNCRVNYTNNEVEIRGLAASHGIEVLGTYNPNDLLLRDNDFIDGVHPKVYVYNKLLVKH